MEANDAIGRLRRADGGAASRLGGPIGRPIRFQAKRSTSAA
jgi:hypothetical protein